MGICVEVIYAVVSDVLCGCIYVSSIKEVIRSATLTLSDWSEVRVSKDNVMVMG